MYSIELSAANAADASPDVRGVGSAGRRVRAPQRRHLARVDPWRKQVSGQERVQIRDWCNANGYRVGSRGPLPFDAVDAFRTANVQRLEQAECGDGRALVFEFGHRRVDAGPGELVDLEALDDLPGAVDRAHRQRRHDALGDAVDTR